MAKKLSGMGFGIGRLITGTALLFGLLAIGAIVVSYFFHTTTIDVYGISSPSLEEAISDDDSEVTIEFYDAPVGGERVDALTVPASDLTIEGDVVRFTTDARTRTLERGTYLQICVDAEGDGHGACVGASDTTDRFDDWVTCSRTEFSPDRFGLSTTDPTHVDLRCSEVSSPFALAFTDATSVEFDGERLDLLEGEINDLSERINRHIIDHPELIDDETNELVVDQGVITVQGPSHEDDQTLSIDGGRLSISNGNTIDLSGLFSPAPTGDDQVIGASLSGTTLQITLENGGSASIDLSSLTQDSDNQVIGLTGDVLTLRNGNASDSSVDLSPYLDNTDSFAAVQCEAGSLSVLALDGSQWSCLDPTASETLTTIGFDAANQTITYVDEDGVTTSIPITALETTTFVQDTLAVGNLIGTYTNEDGTSFELVETVTSLVDNGDQTFTYTNESGLETVLDVNALESLTTLTNTVTGNPIGTYTDENGATFDLNESVTTLIDNGNGTFSFTHEDGSMSTISVSSLETLTTISNVLANGNVIGTYENEGGATVDLLETITALASDGQELTFTDEAGDDTVISIAELETLTEVTDVLTAGNLIGTYVNEDDVEFDLLETVTALSSDGQELTFTDEAGDDTVISIAELETITEVTDLLGAGNLIGTYINEDDVEFDFFETITALASDGQNLVFTDEAGDDTVISIAELETATEVVDLLGAGSLIGTYVNEDDVEFDLLETVTALASDGQNLVFTDEEGVDTTISIAELETITDVTDLLGAGNLIGTYINEDDVEFDFFETVTALSSDGQELTFTDEACLLYTSPSPRD